MFKDRFCIAIGLSLSLLLITLLGRAQEGRPILEGIVAPDSVEAEVLYSLHEDYRTVSQPELACVTLSQAIHTQDDSQKRLQWKKNTDDSVLKRRQVWPRQSFTK